MKSSRPLSIALTAAAILAGCGERDDLPNAAESGRKPGSAADSEALPVRGLDGLAMRDGLIVGEDGKPFTGVIGGLNPEGGKEFAMEVREGRPSGLLRVWDESGQKRIRASFAAGELGNVEVWDAAGASIPLDPDSPRGFERLEDPFESISRGDHGSGEPLVDRLVPRLPGRSRDDQPPVETIPQEDIVIAHPSEVQERQGVIYVRDTDERFSGKVSAEYDDQSSYERYYVYGRRHGRSTSYFSNGQRRLEQHFIEGLKEGPFTAWHENGQKKFETNVEDGRQLGISQHWSADGEVIARWNYTADGQIENAMTTADPQ